ncbi:hypothetical protein Nmel_017044, partial [Mimus melanotis]
GPAGRVGVPLPRLSPRPAQSTVCEKIMELLGQNEVEQRQRKVLILSQDSFYKVLTAEQQAKALKGQYNFDHPGEPLSARPSGARSVLGAQLGLTGSTCRKWEVLENRNVLSPTRRTICPSLVPVVTERPFWSRGEVQSIPACSVLHSLLVRGSLMNHIIPQTLSCYFLSTQTAAPLARGSAVDCRRDRELPLAEVWCL